MTDVFISYSRRDKAFVQVLNDALVESKYDAWVDWENIPLTADWWAEIQAGIEAADTFIFVITPDSIASKVCRQEVDHAVANHKRLVPVVRRDGFDMAQVHPELSKTNWLFFQEENDFDAAFQSLVATLNTDLAHTKNHTRLLVRTLEWEKKQRSDDFLLRGSDLDEAESWLERAISEQHEPLPTEQQKTYIHKSRDAEDANQRLAAAGEKAKRLVRIGAGVLAGTVAIAIVVGVMTRRNALRTRKLAQIEQDSINALQQFEYQQLNALVQAMKAAEDLKDVVGDGAQPLRTYAPQSAPRVLQQILDQITLKNRFTDTPEDPLVGAMSASFSPDGEALVITDTDGNVTLKTLQGIEILALEGHSEEVWLAEFTPDGQTIGTASDVFRLFDRKGNLIKTLEHPSGDASDIQFSPDGQYIALSGWGEDVVSLLDADGNLVTNIDAQTVSSIDFHPKRPILANASRNGTIEIWDFQGNKLNTLEGHKQAVTGVRFSPTGDYLVSGSPDESIRLWNLETQTAEIIDDVDGSTYGIDFHPDGELFAAGSTGGIAKIWDLDGNVVQDLPGHVGAIEDVRFSPDGNMLATAANDGQVRMWSFKGKTIADLAGHTDTLWYPDISPDGTQIATASEDETVRIWDLSGNEIRRLELPDSISNVVYSPDGTTLATATFQGDIQLWDTEGNLITRFAMHNRVIQGLDISPDGQYGVSGSEDFTAKLWDLEGNVITTVAHDNWVRDAVFSPDGQTFATVSEDDLARLWDLDGNLLAEFAGHADGVNGVSFSPDGTKLVTASDDSIVKLWDLQGNLIHSFQNHHGRVWTVAFSPDGEFIATGTSDGYARLWDLDGNLIGEFKGHEAIVTSVNFSPDGQYLVTTSGSLFSRSGDNTAKVWRIASTLDDLLDQGCDWLADYLTLYPDALMELKSCQRPELLPHAAPYLVQKAKQTARTGAPQTVQQQLATALKWNPEVDLDPETTELEQNVAQVARKFSAAYYLTEGQRLADQLKLEEAIQAYEQALELNPTIDLDPDTEEVEQDTDLIARRYAALGLQQQGRLQAQQIKLEAATQTLREALELDPNLDLNPDTDEIEQDAEVIVRQFSAPGQLNAGGQQVKNGDVEAAIQAYQTALDSDPDLEVLQGTWDTLCWFGSVQGQAAKVRFACENEASFSGPSTFDSRGIVLALDGNFEGAIASFQAYIDVPGRSQDRIIQAQAWIDALKAGKNPFLTDD